MASGVISLALELALNGVRIRPIYVSGESFTLSYRASSGSFIDLPTGEQTVVEYENISHTTDQNLSLYMLGLFITNTGGNKMAMATLSIAEVGSDRILGVTYMMDTLGNGIVSLNLRTFSSNTATINSITLCDTLTTELPEVQITIDHDNTSTPTIGS